ncbi:MULTISPECIES: TetR/AcrR family transcriptional regulator [Mycolicibacterium]|uniref:HTH-type transcriptional regulator tcmR n=1 Tax=Mycolicibacterium senegalense TaxID=1796 RepID=A0A378W7L9_9MYCO|nr:MULTISPECIES: TetR/AcrR family transcriptional regulator [Mycolicibacterium]MCV7334314.1 TetR family transcriptional regulator [Mycolicibacterium senegalense]MDR7288304.1 AcrR family transcriptional regulator [Mycolicibacterium senegalense]QZA25264.1 TetR/AcrR family transcriptional regulator [Mycolicibacterium senegalense]CDP85777.1 TetR family transcriptional regulator [Mycolicibacterium farcinogenes]SUA28120.1 HTH-type transcriptional regulator tcmR [Mycolicibacterium senegalense]
MARSRGPTLTERRAEELRLDIARTARDIFIADGDTTATVERICAEVGIATRTFYRHFPVKEDVLGPLFRRSESHMRNLLASAAAEADPVDVLVDMFTVEVRQRRTVDVQHRESVEIGRKLMALVAETPQYRLRWLDWSATLADSITEYLAGHFELGDDEFARALPSRLIIHVSSNAYIWWTDAKELHELDELVAAHRSGIGMVLSGLQRSDRSS